MIKIICVEKQIINTYFNNFFSSSDLSPSPRATFLSVCWIWNSALYNNSCCLYRQMQFLWKIKNKSHGGKRLFFWSLGITKRREERRREERRREERGREEKRGEEKRGEEKRREEKRREEKRGEEKRREEKRSGWKYIWFFDCIIVECFSVKRIDLKKVMKKTEISYRGK